MKPYNIYFSPTGGTEKVAGILAKGLADETEIIDLTDPDKDLSSVAIGSGDIALIAVPSFGGRVPATAAERISAIDGNGARAVLVCVYGGRAYEDTLIELRDLAVDAGFKVIAAVSAVAEHSIARSFAKGRPDKQDISSLKECSTSIADKISRGDDSEPHVPGNTPYKKYGVLKITPFPDEDCVKCMLCAEKCPVQAIDKKDPADVDEDVCISCMRCISVCPHSARKVKREPLEKLEKMLTKACRERKECELFI